MNRSACGAGLWVAVVALAVAPWAAGLPHAPDPVTEPIVRTSTYAENATGSDMAQVSSGRGARGGCGCDEVVVNAVNTLRDAKVRSGDAKVRNVNVVYISAAYVQTVSGQIEIEVEQRANATSGDALAGQLIGALHVGPRCANILIRAINDLEDVEVRSGDAKAINRNLVLLDPGVDRGRISLDVTQEANATSGRAIAGQVIGAGGAGGGDGCGGVTVEADNRLADVEVETGKAKMRNDSSIQTCAEVGCIPELLAAARRASAVRMCTADGCRWVPSRELAAQLSAVQTPSPEPVPAEEAEPAPSETQRPERTREPTDGPDGPEPDGGGDPSIAETTPSPSPTPASA